MHVTYWGIFARCELYSESVTEQKTIKSVMKLILGKSLEERKNIKATSVKKTSRSNYRTSIPSRKSTGSLKKSKLPCRYY